MIDVNELTIGQVKEIAKMVECGSVAGGGSHSLVIGKSYFVRTVTFHMTGRLKAVTDCDIVLSDAAWVADSGRFADALKTGKLAEVEPYPDEVIINREAIVDVSGWLHDLPRGQV